MNEEKKNPLDVVRGREPAFGPLLAVLVILAILVGGASYFWSGWQGKSPTPTATSTEVVIYVNNNQNATGSPTDSVAPAGTATSSAETGLNIIEQNLENQNTATSSGY